MLAWWGDILGVPGLDGRKPGFKLLSPETGDGWGVELLVGGCNGDSRLTFPFSSCAKILKEEKIMCML